jgi:hypothetical protein
MAWIAPRRRARRAIRLARRRCVGRSPQRTRASSPNGVVLSAGELTIAFVANRSSGADAANACWVAIGIAGSRRVGTIALEECNRRACAAVRPNRTAELGGSGSGRRLAMTVVRGARPRARCLGERQPLAGQASDNRGLNRSSGTGEGQSSSCAPPEQCLRSRQEVDFIDDHRARRAANHALAKRVDGPFFVGSRLLSVQLLWNECVRIVEVRSHLDRARHAATGSFCLGLGAATGPCCSLSRKQRSRVQARPTGGFKSPQLLDLPADSAALTIGSNCGQSTVLVVVCGSALAARPVLSRHVTYHRPWVYVSATRPLPPYTGTVAVSPCRVT